MTVTVRSISPEALRGIAVVGKVVTIEGEQFRVWSAQGSTWLAQVTTGGHVAAQLDMEPAHWITAPRVWVTPMNGGQSRALPLDQCRVGVTLRKTR